MTGRRPRHTGEQQSLADGSPAHHSEHLYERYNPDQKRSTMQHRPWKTVTMDAVHSTGLRCWPHAIYRGVASALCTMTCSNPAYRLALILTVKTKSITT